MAHQQKRASEIQRVDYTTKDYNGYREDMVRLIPQKLPEWTDRSPNDPGIVLLELLAYQLEKESYYNDRIANEVFLSTATQRRSVINHCKLIGYELEWQTASKHWQVVEIVPQPTDVIIPRGTTFGTPATTGEESIIFESLEDLVIPANATGTETDEFGEYLYKVEVEQGQTIRDEFMGTITTDDAGQEFKFVYSPVLRDSINLHVSDFSGKRSWELVTDFISSLGTSEHYVVEMDEYDIARVQFGNGVSGMIPIPSSEIFVDYKVGGGVIGNVGSNTITEVYSSIDGFVSTFNPYGYHVAGKDKESLEDAKWRGPASLKRLNRYVTLPDYEAGVLLDFAAVAKAKAINNAGDVDLYIVPRDGYIASPTLKAEMMEVIENKKVMFTTVRLLDPTYIDFDLEVDIIIYDNYDPEIIRYTATNVLREFFSAENVGFGDDVKIAEIHHVLISIDGVSNAIIAEPAGDIMTVDTQIPRLVNLTVYVDGQ